MAEVEIVSSNDLTVTFSAKELFAEQSVAIARVEAKVDLMTTNLAVMAANTVSKEELRNTRRWTIGASTALTAVFVSLGAAIMRLVGI